MSKNFSHDNICINQDIVLETFAGLLQERFGNGELGEERWQFGSSVQK